MNVLEQEIPAEETAEKLGLKYIPVPCTELEGKKLLEVKTNERWILFICQEGTYKLIGKDYAKCRLSKDNFMGGTITHFRTTILDKNHVLTLSVRQGLLYRHTNIVFKAKLYKIEDTWTEDIQNRIKQGKMPKIPPVLEGIDIETHSGMCEYAFPRDVPGCTEQVQEITCKDATKANRDTMRVEAQAICIEKAQRALREVPVCNMTGKLVTIRAYTNQVTMVCSAVLVCTHCVRPQNKLVRNYMKMWAYGYAYGGSFMYEASKETK